MKASTSSSVQNLSPMIGTESRRGQDMLDLMQRTPPEKVHLNLNDYDKLINQFALINEYKSKAAEQETNPELAAARQLNDQDLLKTYQGTINGDLPVSVQNALASAGLENQIGTGTRIAPGSKGKATLTELYGRGTNDYVNSIRGMMSQYLASRPRQNAGLDPSSAANMRLGNVQDNANVENAFRQQLMSATMGANQNRSNLAASFGNAAAAQGAGNAAAKNSSAGATLGAVAGTAAAVIGGAAVIF